MGLSIAESKRDDLSRVHGRGRATSLLGLLSLVALAVIIGAGGARSAYAATTITVNCTTDPGSLASALVVASDGDTLAIQGTCTGTFEIAHSLTLAGTSGAILDGQAAGAVITIDPGQAVAVSDLTITNGHGTVGGFSTVGGIFNNAGALTLTSSTVSGNSAAVTEFHNGVGGIFNLGGRVTLTDSTVSENSAVASASHSTAVGGILNLFGVVTVTSSTVTGNSTGGTPSNAFGGILNSSPSSIVTLTNSTVSGNSASAPGVSAFNAVGGISNSGGSLTLTSSTLSGNSASEPDGGSMPPVSGISNVFGGNLIAEDTLIAGQSPAPDCFGLAPSSDGGYNLDDGTSCGFSTANHSISNMDPLLDPAGLQDNGGPTQTIALLSGSPAIDAIPPGINGCGTRIATDQRGVSRPQGPGCDIGAFELVPPVVDLSITKAGAPNPVVSGNRLTYTLAVTNAGPDGATDVTVTDPLPDNVHFNSVASTQGSCVRSSTKPKPAPKDGTVTCSVGNLANGASASITIVVTTTTPGGLANTATVRGNEPDPNPLNNSATATTTVIGT